MPELNAAENIWQYLRQTYLANRVFADYAAVLDACRDAWRKLLAETGRITSIDNAIGSPSIVTHRAGLSDHTAIRDCT